MTFEVEIVLRERNFAVTEHHEVAAPEQAWTDHHVEQVLRSMLTALDRARNPDADERFVTLRGFSWIAEPTPEGVVIAIEIPTGAAVAGPFQIEQPRLDAMINRVLAAAAPDRPVVH